MRSKLFVPGSRPELFAKALGGEADAISIDLEDAVEEGRKAEARATVGKLLRSMPPFSSGKVIIVRVNGLETGHVEADLDAVAWPALDLVNLPKAESADDIRAGAEALARREAGRGIERRIGILATIESPRGLRRAAEIATADPRVAGLQVGFGDLFEPLGIDRKDPAAVHQVQLQVRLAAGEAGISAYDAAYAVVRDPEGFRKEAEVARRLGYLGKSCIHPSQVALANEAFRPTDAEIAWALRVEQASHEAKGRGVGAFLVDGRMIDAPFIRRAETVVAVARRLGLLPSEAGSGP
jgi:citrate lyase subunit beta/citryl-CoA lyase